MSTVVTFNGLSYIVPATGDVGWGNNVSSYLIAIAAGALQKTGGSFVLSAETDFGPSFGLKSLYYKSESANLASSGILRLANNSDAVSFRNAANSANLPLAVNSSDQLTFNGTPIGGASIFTANRAIISNGSGNLDVSVTTSTEIGFVSGVTSSIQTQLNAKEPTITILPISKGGTNSGTALNNNRIIQSSSGSIVEASAITAARALISDANGIPTQSVTTSAELAFVSGVTSAIQTQLNGKASTALNNLASVAINVSLLPAATNSIDLGSSSKAWATTNTHNLSLLLAGTGTSGALLWEAPSGGSYSLRVADTASTRIVTIPDPGTGANFVLSESDQTINGTLSFSTSILPTTTLAGGVGSASKTWGGMFSQFLTLGDSTPHQGRITLYPTTGAGLAFIQTSTQTSGSNAFNIPDISSGGDFVITSGTQTIAGAKTFSSTVTSNGTIDGFAHSYSDADPVTNDTSGLRMTNTNSGASSATLITHAVNGNRRARWYTKASGSGGISTFDVRDADGTTWNSALIIPSTGDVYSTAFTDYSSTSTIVGWTTFTAKQIFYKTVGKTVYVWYRLSGTSNSTTTSFTLPFGVDSSIFVNHKPGVAVDNNVDVATAQGQGNSSTMTFFKDSAGTGWTASGTKILWGQFTYQAV